MQIIGIDIVGLQSLQAALQALGKRSRIVISCLGHDKTFFPFREFAQHVADAALAVAVVIAFCGIEVEQSLIQGDAHQLGGEIKRRAEGESWHHLAGLSKGDRRHRFGSHPGGRGPDGQKGARAKSRGPRNKIASGKIF